MTYTTFTKYNNYMIISIDTQRAFDKGQYSFMTKTLNNIGIDGTYLNAIKAMFEKHILDIMIHAKK